VEVITVWSLIAAASIPGTLAAWWFGLNYFSARSDMRDYEADQDADKPVPFTFPNAQDEARFGRYFN
jgi:hypothetical protein